jgi:hypothetical protein
LTDGGRLGAAYSRLNANERLGVIGALIVVGSLFFPWYGLPLNGGIAKTGWAALGWAEAAIVLTVASIVFMLYERSRGRVLPEPLDEAKLMLIGGGWAAALIVYAMFDKPTFRLSVARIEETYNLRYGIFVGLAGAVVILVAGWRDRAVSSSARRREEASEA